MDGWMKRRIVSCVGDARRRRAREDASEETGTMDERMDGVIHNGTGRGDGEEAKEGRNEGLTMRTRGDTDGSILLLRRERGFHAQR
jgi:hypothetical protein